jgi:hypothetical protein
VQGVELVAGGGGARGLSLSRAAAEVTVEGTSIGYIRVDATGRMKNPKGFGVNL